MTRRDVLYARSVSLSMESKSQSFCPAMGIGFDRVYIKDAEQERESPSRSHRRATRTRSVPSLHVQDSEHAMVKIVS